MLWMRNGSTLLFCPVPKSPEPYSSLSMKQESNKEVYLTPEAEELVLSIEATIAASSGNTETIDDDQEEHGWTTNP